MRDILDEFRQAIHDYARHRYALDEAAAELAEHKAQHLLSLIRERIAGGDECAKGALNARTRVERARRHAAAKLACEEATK